MKKIKFIILTLVIGLIVVSCSYNSKGKNSEEDLIKEFIELNYSTYKDDSETMKGIEFSLIGKAVEEQDKEVKEALKKLSKKYGDLLSKDCFDNFVSCGLFTAMENSVAIDKIEIKDLKIEQAKYTGGYNVSFKANYSLKDKIVFTDEVNSTFLVEPTDMGGDKKTTRIVNTTNYKTPSYIINNFRGNGSNKDKDSEIKFIKEFIEFNYDNYLEDNKIVKDLELTDARDIKDTEKNEEIIEKVRGKYGKFFTKASFDQSIASSNFLVYIENLKDYKVELKDLEIEFVEESRENNYYKSTANIEINAPDDRNETLDFQSEFTISEEDGELKISDIYYTYSPNQVVDLVNMKQ